MALLFIYYIHKLSVIKQTRYRRNNIRLLPSCHDRAFW